MNEYFWPHFPQKPKSRLSGASQFEQKRLCSGIFRSGRIVFSGSVEGSSGSVISPAPSCRRDVLDEECRVRREPCAARLTGEDPVPVMIDREPVPFLAGADLVGVETDTGRFSAAAWPQMLQ
jgi:hypothetical protein